MRRTKKEIEAIKEGLAEILAGHHPQTVRGIFYQAVSAGLVEKTELEYKNTVCRILKDMRLSGVLPFHWIVENTRLLRKLDTWSSLESMMTYSRQSYRRVVWEDQPVYVEIWCEKDTIAGLLYEVTSEWDVPLKVSRGFASLSFLYEAAETINGKGKPAFIYYLGDWDPSGVCIGETIEKRINQFAPEADIQFERIAVRENQIERWNLPIKPTKKTDSRENNFKGKSVELDAIPAHYLKGMVLWCIENHLDKDIYEQTLMAEQAERETLAAIAAGLGINILSDYSYKTP